MHDSEFAGRLDFNQHNRDTFPAQRAAQCYSPPYSIGDWIMSLVKVQKTMEQGRNSGSGARANNARDPGFKLPPGIFFLIISVYQMWLNRENLKNPNTRKLQNPKTLKP